MLRRYGLDTAQRAALFARNGGVCPLCRERPATVIDHDHVTGRVRGALCTACNTALHVIERPDWVVRAREYVDVTLQEREATEVSPFPAPGDSAEVGAGGEDVGEAGDSAQAEADAEADAAEEEVAPKEEK